MRVFPVKSKEKVLSDANQFLVIALLFGGVWVYAMFVNPASLKPQTVAMMGVAAIAVLFKSAWSYYKASRM